MRRSFQEELDPLRMQVEQVERMGPTVDQDLERTSAARLVCMCEDAPAPAEVPPAGSP